MITKKAGGVCLIHLALAALLAVPAAEGRGAQDNAEAPSARNARLLKQSDLVYKGAFRVPAGNFGCDNGEFCSFHYGAGPIAYNPARNSLYIAGHRWHQYMAEVSIPEIEKATRLDQLATAALIQPFSDITNGHRNRLLPDGGVIDNGGTMGGLLVYEGRLIGTSFGWYDAANAARLSHFVAPLDLASSSTRFQGMYQVGERPSVPGAGFVSGYLTFIPKQWQEPLGGSVITGNAGISIISRSSLGPAAFAFEPSDLGRRNPVAAAPLVYYPISHPSLGGYRSESPYYNGTTQIRGVVFPSGSRSLLFFGRQGSGPFCYGAGTKTLPVQGKNNCYDPVFSDKGSHAYPYHYQVWAYDAVDLQKVKEGKEKPWEIKPYAVWKMDLPFKSDKSVIASATYDAANRRIFLLQDYGEGNLPLVHVLEIAEPQ